MSLKFAKWTTCWLSADLHPFPFQPKPGPRKIAHLQLSFLGEGGGGVTASAWAKEGERAHMLGAGCC